MNETTYETFDFWHDAFAERGFKRDSHQGLGQEVWFRKGMLSVGFNASNFREKKYPLFHVAYEAGVDRVQADFRVAIESFKVPFIISGMPDRVVMVSEFIEVLDMIARPKGMPLAVGIEWMAEIVDFYFRNVKTSED